MTFLTYFFMKNKDENSSVELLIQNDSNFIFKLVPTYSNILYKSYLHITYFFILQIN